jgi:DNA invertase Pin-like site-specific DNA recombinase
MLHLLETDGTCLVILVEKTDRLYRNCTDALAFAALIEKRGVEIHLVKEGRVIGKESRSQDKFMHDIHVAVAKHYVENLKEEVKKGMREKAEEGIYPGRVPIGYRNNSLTRSIDVDPEHAPMVKRIFELYASGEHSHYAPQDRAERAWPSALSLVFRDDSEESFLSRILCLAGRRVQGRSRASDLRPLVRPSPRRVRGAQQAETTQACFCVCEIAQMRT